MKLNTRLGVQQAVARCENMNMTSQSEYIGPTLIKSKSIKAKEVSSSKAK